MNIDRLLRDVERRLLDGTHLPTSTDIATFGTFIGTCESKGMKVVLDMVVNHAGYGARGHFDAAWFNTNGVGDVKSELAGLPDFNHDAPQVIDYFIKNIEEWITRGKVTNIRMDTVKHVEPKFWHYFKSQIRGQYPAVCLIGEVLFEGKEDIGKLLQYQNYHDFVTSVENVPPHQLLAMNRGEAEGAGAHPVRVRNHVWFIPYRAAPRSGSGWQKGDFFWKDGTDWIDGIDPSGRCRYRISSRVS